MVIGDRELAIGRLVRRVLVDERRQYEQAHQRDAGDEHTATCGLEHREQFLQPDSTHGAFDGFGVFKLKSQGET